MGIQGFYEWVQKTHKYEPIEVKLQSSDSFVVDTKLLLYKKNALVSTSCENVAKELAEIVASSFAKFPNVLFVLDGIKKISPMKCSTIIKRKKRQATALLKVEEETEDLKIKRQKIANEVKSNEGEEREQKEKQLILEDLAFAIKEEGLEKKARYARGVSTAISMEVLKYLSEMGFKTLQCEGEADPILVDLASQFTYVISEDSDLLVAGISNLLRFFGSKNLLYNANDILEKSKLTLLQLKQLACMSGCDYTSGLEGMGMKTADKLMQKHKNFENIMKHLDREKYSPCDDFTKVIEKACILFGGQKAIEANDLKEQESKEKEPFKDQEAMNELEIKEKKLHLIYKLNSSI